MRFLCAFRQARALLLPSPTFQTEAFASPSEHLLWMEEVKSKAQTVVEEKDQRSHPMLDGARPACWVHLGWMLLGN